MVNPQLVFVLALKFQLWWVWNGVMWFHFICFSLSLMGFTMATAIYSIWPVILWLSPHCLIFPCKQYIKDHIISSWFVPKSEHKAQQTVLQKIREAIQGEDIPGNQILTQIYKMRHPGEAGPTAWVTRHLRKKGNHVNGQRMQGELKETACTWISGLLGQARPLGLQTIVTGQEGFVTGLKSVPTGTLGGSRPLSWSLKQMHSHTRKSRSEKIHQHMKMK